MKTTTDVAQKITNDIYVSFALTASPDKTFINNVSQKMAEFISYKLYFLIIFLLSLL